MNNFRFAKIIVGVGPILAKETILSKIVNMVDVFRISLSQGFDDNNKKYVETILKLDNSKTIMLETRGNDLRVKNIMEISLKKKEEIIVEYSEYAQESVSRIFIDYPFLGKLPKGTLIRFEQSDIILEVGSTKDDYATCTVTQGGTLIQYDRILFDNHVMDAPFLIDRDKKDILWGLEHGIHVIAASSIKTKHDIESLKEFLQEQNVAKMKVFAKIETKEALENLDEIIETADGLILVFDKIESFMKAAHIKQEDLIKKCKEAAKPVIVTFVGGVNTKEYPLCNKEYIKKACSFAVDGFMVETMITEDAPLEITTKLSDLLGEFELDKKESALSNFYDGTEFLVRDYIIYNAYRITQELSIKAIVCYTENGYTTSRFASFSPSVPVIAFTKFDETYRYLNMLWGVKGYKISQSFSYENLKRIGKEMIRIIFKGNISLDDKVIIVQADEVVRDEKTGMINGLELYKFKNI